MPVGPFVGQGELTPKAVDGFEALLTGENPQGYIADPNLTAAVNVAIILGQPLLITGEPGVGKSLLAHRIAYEFAQDEPLIAIARTASTAADLFYQFDALGRFLDVQDKLEKAADPTNYIKCQALGLAILLALPEPFSTRYQKLLPEEWQGRKPMRPVVLIDELDKAPRDLPNDILNEVERMEFYLRENDNELIPDFRKEVKDLTKGVEDEEEVKRLVKVVEGYKAAFQSNRPIIILTSNDEKRLPDAFLRRCVYYHIPFPDAETLRNIVRNRLKGEKLPKPRTIAPYLEEAYLKAAVDLFLDLRERVHDKQPSTAELIAWMRILAREEVDLTDLTAIKNQSPNDIFENAKKKLLPTIGILAKSDEDANQMRLYLTPSNSTGGNP